VEWGSGWVIKADGLALGKGVVVCADRAEALAASEEFFCGLHGEAGKKIVVEERLAGREVSAFFLCDGETGAPLGMACDYKRIFDNDQGPNTGGMGAFAPADWLPSDFLERVGAEVTKPLLREMNKRGNPFKGMLFVGLMVNGADSRVLEFNARFGDPETQALLPMLAEDLYPWLRASRDGRLGNLPASGPRMKPGSSVHVVAAAHGYPGTPRKGDSVTVDPAFENSWKEGVKLFYAGVSRSGPSLRTNGGRVLGVTALGATREEARLKAQAWSSRVTFSGAQRRQDVGK
jgi:phosphoribosylamine--glycine ligase